MEQMQFQLTNEDGPLTFSREDAELDIYRGKDAKEGQYILLQTFWVEWIEKGTMYRLRVPQGYITDVASVPRWAWSFSGILPDGWHRNAALIHDVLYMWQGCMPPGWFQKLENYKWVDVFVKWSKNDSDRMFLRIMKACKVTKWTRFRMYYAVALGGWPAWWRTDPTREKYRNAFKPD